MSNSTGNKEQGKLIGLSEQQCNPGSAKPEDFCRQSRRSGSTGARPAWCLEVRRVAAA